MDRCPACPARKRALLVKELTCMSNFLDTVRGLFDPATHQRPCTACGSESLWRPSLTAAYRCRACDPPTSLPVADVIGRLERPSEPTPHSADYAVWLTIWREVAAMTDGVSGLGVQEALRQCDAAFASGDLYAFKVAASKVHAARQQENVQQMVKPAHERARTVVRLYSQSCPPPNGRTCLRVP